MKEINFYDMCESKLKIVIKLKVNRVDPIGSGGSVNPVDPVSSVDLNTQIQNVEGLSYLQSLPNDSVDLVLTDPPYIISHDSGMDQLYQETAHNEASGTTQVKTEAEWEHYRIENNLPDDKTHREKYLQYGTIYGKKYCVRTQYGSWDDQFTMAQLDLFLEQFQRVLRKGGTLIIFFDLWKITPLKGLLEQHNFKQIRFIEWLKTNPQPLNSKINYLTNCREIALLGIKGSCPTFNSSYDNGLYQFPLQGGKNRCHPTQKSLELFKILIQKHSNPGDLVLDPFLGSGTTALACQQLGRRCLGSEISKEYFDQIINLLKKETSTSS